MKSLIISGIFVTSLALLTIAAKNAMHTMSPDPTITAISIFADYLDPSFTGSTAPLEETLKTIDAQCDHIFTNKLLWKECTQKLDKESYMQNWSVYDTHIGLLYMQFNKHHPDIGFNIKQWTHIEDPFDITIIDQISDDAWPKKFETLFDISRWNQAHRHQNSKIIIYMNGHGTRRTNELEVALSCGISASDFARVLKIFNDQLHIHVLGIQSCFWTTERIHELMQNYGYTTLHFTILTPLSSEQGLWLDTCNNYKRKKGSSFCFFDTCLQFTHLYHDALTTEIKDIINSTDTLQLLGNKQQQATLLLAGTDTLITV